MHENPSSGSRVVQCGQTDVTKLIIFCRNFANALKKTQKCGYNSDECRECRECREFNANFDVNIIMSHIYTSMLHITSCFSMMKTNRFILYMKKGTLYFKYHAHYTNNLPEDILLSFLMLQQMMYIVITLSYSISFTVLPKIIAR